MIGNRASSVCAVLAAAATVAVAASCATAPAAPEAERATVDHPGRYLTRYRGSRVEVVVDSEYASRSAGEPWLILNVAITGTRRISQEIRASAIRLVTPDGRTIPLPPYAEINRRRDEIVAAGRRAEITADPLGVFQAGREWLPLRFHPMPGGRTPHLSSRPSATLLTDAYPAAMTSVWVNNRKIYWGPLYFPVEGGVVPGEYDLEIELRDGTVVRIPFQVS